MDLETTARVHDELWRRLERAGSAFRRLPEGVVPPDAERLRRVWRRFHLVRTALAVAAFAFLVTAASYA